MEWINVIHHFFYSDIQVGMARASILWLIGEYSEYVPKIAPDVLRIVAKSFIQQDDIVKLQAINLAAKLYVTNYKQVELPYIQVLLLRKKCRKTWPFYDVTIGVCVYIWFV